MKISKENNHKIKMAEIIELKNLYTGETYTMHESSYVDEGANIGEGTRIWHFCHIMKGAKVGKNCSIGQNVNIGSRAIIGNNVKIQNNVSVYDDVIIEDSVFCGPSMVFTNVVNPRAFLERKNEYKKTLVKIGASIGANATIVCGHTIGTYAFIGAGAVITKDVPDYALMIGVPAKQKGWVCKCGVVLKKSSISNNIINSNDNNHSGFREQKTGETIKFICEECGNIYEENFDSNNIRLKVIKEI